MSGDTVFAVASGKGGVGKTTTTVNLGTAIAAAGHRVAIVDADLGMANLAGFVNLTTDDATLYDVLAGDAEVEAASYEVADGIVVVPSGTDLERYADVDAAGLTDVIDHLRGEFDYVLLDVGAGVSHETVLPLGLADSVIVVVTPEPGAVSDAEKTVDLVDRADGTTTGLVLNKTRLDDGVSDTEIATHIGVELLASVPEDSLVRESLQAGTPLVAYEPESPASIGFRTLAATLIDDVPAPDVSPMEALERSNTEDDAAGESAESDDESATADEEPVLLDTDGADSSATDADASGDDSSEPADEDVETEPPADILGGQAETDEAPDEPVPADPAAGDADEEAMDGSGEETIPDEPREGSDDEETAPESAAPTADEGEADGTDSDEGLSDDAPGADDEQSEQPTAATDERSDELAEAADEASEADGERSDEPPESPGEPAEADDERSDELAEAGDNSGADDADGVVIEDEELEEDDIPFRADTDDSIEFDDDESAGFDDASEDAETGDADAADTDADEDDDEDSGGLLSRLLGR